MQSDDIVWQLINKGFCSFKAKIENNTFCKNQYNVTGLCNRTSCPLANSKYATIIEKDGVCYLYMKEVERSHTPSKLWDMIKLSNNYKDALAQIDQHLMYWPKHLIHRNKQRLTKIWQYLIRMRRLRSKVRTSVTTINQKVERREKVREAKALKAAGLENQIKSELLDRLKQGTYGGIYNFDSQSFQEVLDEEGIEDEAMFLPEGEEEVDDEFVEDYNDDFDDLEGDSDASDINSDDIPSDMEDGDDDDESEEDVRPAKQQPKKRAAPASSDEKKRPTKKPKRAHVNIEYEEEMEPQTSRQTL